jgi:hypothetical protein
VIAGGWLAWLRDRGRRGVGHRPAVVRAVRRRRHRGVPGHQPPERAGPAERARRLATDGVGRLPEARTRERVVALPPERELLPELQARPGPEPLAAPEMVVAQRRGIRGAVAPPGAMAKGRAGPPARRARSGAVRFRAEHAPPRAAVPREPPVKPGVAAGRRLLTGPAGTRRPARSARPMMARAGPAGLPRAQARATAREPHPATGRAGPPGRPREVVSAARPRRQRADHVGPLQRSTARPGSGARRPTAPGEAMTGPPRATRHAGLTVRTVPLAVTAAAAPRARSRELRTVRRVSGLEAVVRARAARTRLAAGGPILRPGRPAGAARTARLPGQPVAVPGKERVPGFPRPAVRLAAISRARVPRTFLMRLALSSSIPRPGPS